MSQQEKPDKQDVFEVYTRRKVKAASIWRHGMGVNTEDLNPILVTLRQAREIGLHHIAPIAPLTGAMGHAPFSVQADAKRFDANHGGQIHNWDGLGWDQVRDTRDWS